MYGYLEGKTVVATTDINKFIANAEDAKKKRVAYTEINTGERDITISTVFLGLDHSFSDDTRSLWFETLVFDGPNDGDMARYETWDEAEAGHNTMVQVVLDALKSEGVPVVSVNGVKKILLPELAIKQVVKPKKLTRGMLAKLWDEKIAKYPMCFAPANESSDFDEFCDRLGELRGKEIK
jgi:hypothetical protein